MYFIEKPIMKQNGFYIFNLLLNNALVSHLMLQAVVTSEHSRSLYPNSLEVCLEVAT